MDHTGTVNMCMVNNRWSYLVAVEEVGVCGVHVARLHSDHIRDEFRRWRHSFLEEVDNNAVESFAQRRVSPEVLLKIGLNKSM